MSGENSSQLCDFTLLQQTWGDSLFEVFGFYWIMIILTLLTAKGALTYSIVSLSPLVSGQKHCPQKSKALKQETQRHTEQI